MRLFKKYKKKKEEGFVLMVSLAFVLLFTLSAASFSDMMFNQTNASKYSCYSTKAFYLAEAGLRREISEWRQDGTSQNFAATSLAGMGDYEVSIAIDGVSGGSIV